MLATRSHGGGDDCAMQAARRAMGDGLAPLVRKLLNMAAEVPNAR